MEKNQQQQATKPAAPAADVKGNLKDIVSKTAQSGSKPSLPKGNALEQTLQGQPGEAPRKPGRPPGSANKATAAAETPAATTTPATPGAATPAPVKPPIECCEVDTITPVACVLIAPIVAKRTRRKKEDLMFNPDQMEALRKVQPKSALNEPSWPAYIGLFIATMMMNVYSHEEVKPDPKDLKKATDDVMKFTTRKNKPENGSTASAGEEKLKSEVR